MSGFDEREKAFEAKYHLDEDLGFKTSVRRAKLLGLWAAEKLGLSGEAGTAYARTLVEVDLGDPAHSGLLTRVRADLRAGGQDAQIGRLADEFHRLEAEARRQIIAEVTAGRQVVSPE